MGLLTGAVSCTRFAVAVPAAGPDWDAAAFHAIEPGSEVRERAGIVPWELGAEWEWGVRRYAFRVRIDRRHPDPTAVRERVAELVRAEREATGAPFVGPKKRRELRELAEAELVALEQPRLQLIECAIDGSTLYVGSTAKSQLGYVLTVLRGAGVAADFKAPWFEDGTARDALEALSGPEEPTGPGGAAIAREPGQSTLGCRFARSLLEDPDVLIEPETGAVRLLTHEAKVTLAGGVLGDLHRYVEQGAQILSVKLHLLGIALTFDALSYRLNGIQLEAARGEHWSERLAMRVEQVSSVWDVLDAKYEAQREMLAEAESASAATSGRNSRDEST